MSIRESGLGKKIVLIVVMTLVLFGVVIGAFLYWANSPIRLPAPKVEFTIESGASLGRVTATLHAAGVQVPELPFKALARQMGVSTRLQAGAYQIEAPITPRELLSKLYRGDVQQIEVTLPEGWTFRQFRARLDAMPTLRHDTSGKTDAEVMQLIGATEASPEGLFFPDTYLVAKGGADTTVLRAAYRKMSEVLGALWSSRPPGLRLKSPYEALILASIVEKETGSPDDRPMIASVFHNRLRIGMRLQTDPTVIYGLGARFDGNLRKKDLLDDTPYNTYTRAGLPPSPIAMPGRESILATLSPPDSDMLYFVARGDGRSEFSATLEAHNRAVKKFQRGGK